MDPHSSVIRRVLPRSVAAGVLAILFGAGCSYFPKHEDVYIPIPLNIGESRVENGDTVYVLSELGYRVVAPRQQVLADVQHDLEGAARQFQVYFDALPDTVTIRFVDSIEVRDIRDFPTMELNGARIENGEIVLPARPSRRMRTGGVSVPPPFRASPAAARLWLAAHARRVQAANRPGGIDSAAVPAWITSAMADVIVQGASPVSAAMLAREGTDLDSLRVLFEMRSLIETEDLNRPGRRDLERWRLRRLQAMSVASFIVEREDKRFLGRLAERLFAGVPITEALRGAEHLPADIGQLEEQWRAWVREHGRR
jgi:hypothetical protein